MKPGDKLWVFDGYKVRRVCVESISVSPRDGVEYVVYDGIKGCMRLAHPDLCFPTREALCEHYRKIFE